MFLELFLNEFIKIDWVGQNLEHSWQLMQLSFLSPKQIKCLDLKLVAFNELMFVHSKLNWF